MKRMFSYSGRCTEISLKFYGQRAIFGAFVRKFLAIMMKIYGQSRLFGSFVRKTWSKPAEFLRTKGCF